MPKTHGSQSRISTRADVSSAVTSIRRIVRVLRLASQRTRAQAGIGAAPLFVLQQLGDAEGHSLNALAERTMTDRSSVAAVVDRLASERLVDRTVDPDDRRRAVVRITTARRRVLGRAPDAPTTALLVALRRLDRGELAGRARSLGRLTEVLGVSDEPQSMLFADDAPPRRRSRPDAKTRLAKRVRASDG